MRLSALFGDGMVIQREQVNYIWGYTEPKCEITGIFDGKQFKGIVRENGYFEAKLPELPVGGPYELTIQGDETITIKDVLVGDVFLLSGQSNMELPLNRTLELFEKELADTDEPDIRLFEVPKEFDFAQEREMISGAKWIKASGEELYIMSAVGFFMAKELRKNHPVPIGLLQSAVGGAPARAYCKEETIKRQGYYIEELEQCKVPGYVESVQKKDLENEEKWRNEAWESYKGKPISAGTIEVPDIWFENELKDFHGALRITREFTLTKEQAEGCKEIALGAIIDADRVYINDVFVGNTEYKYPPRFYQIPEGTLKEGINKVEIQLLVFREVGGFVKDKPYGIRNKGEKEVFLDLSGTWKYEVMKEMEVLPDATFFIWKAAALYNGMLSPLRRWNVKGCFFYQGESDVGKEDRYVKEIEALVQDIRTLWNNDSMPFIYVQLAGYSDCIKENQKIDWAEFREAQEKNLSIPYTAMATAFDIGYYNDLHPFDKKTLGNRLALCARKLIYQEDVICYAPTVKEVGKTEDSKIYVLFNEDDVKLFAGKDGNDTEIHEVEIEDEQGAFHKAKAILSDNHLLAWVDGINSPKSIRYSFRNCPLEPNLFSQIGLPVLPFRRSL